MESAIEIIKSVDCAVGKIVRKIQESAIDNRIKSHILEDLILLEFYLNMQEGGD